jgi:hypothetical protein
MTAGTDYTQAAAPLRPATFALEGGGPVRPAPGRTGLGGRGADAGTRSSLDLSLLVETVRNTQTGTLTA